MGHIEIAEARKLMKACGKTNRQIKNTPISHMRDFVRRMQAGIQGAIVVERRRSKIESILHKRAGYSDEAVTPGYQAMGLGRGTQLTNESLAEIMEGAAPTPFEPKPPIQGKPIGSVDLVKIKAGEYVVRFGDSTLGTVSETGAYWQWQAEGIPFPYGRKYKTRKAAVQGLVDDANGASGEVTT